MRIFYFTTSFSASDCFRKARIKFRRYYDNPQGRKVLYLFLFVFFLWLYMICLKNPHEASILRAQITEEISKVMGTRITAVRLLPDKNTAILQPEFACDGDLFATILVKSHPDNAHHRQMLRETWFKFMSRVDVKMKAFFFISVDSARLKTSENLFLEQSAYNDLIVDDLTEHKYLQTLKSLRILKWFNQSYPCLKSKYLFKTWDTSFLNVPNIVDHINSIPNAWVNYIGGVLYVDQYISSDPSSSWFSPTDWHSKYEYSYPPFVSGPLTIFASETIPEILKASLQTPLHHLEDIYISGMIGFHKLSILPYDIPRIEYGNSLWFTRIKMALSLRDMAKTNLAFDCAEDINFIKELYHQQQTTDAE